MSQSHLLRVLAAFVVLPLAIWGVPADAQGPAMPKLVNIGTNPPGSVFYAMGSALAKVVSGAAPFQMGVQPIRAPARSSRCSTAASWSSAS